MKVIKFGLIFAIITSLSTVSFAEEATHNIIIDEPGFTYETSGSIRMAKILNIEGTLSHKMSEPVAGVLKKDGVLLDAKEVASDSEGKFTFRFTLENNLPQSQLVFEASTHSSNGIASKTISAVGLGTEALFTSFKVGAHIGSISGTAITVDASADTYDVSAVVPVFTVSHDAIVKVGGTEQISGVSVVNFSNGAVTYEVISEDRASTTQYSVTVTPAESGDVNENTSNPPFSSGGGGNGKSEPDTVVDDTPQSGNNEDINKNDESIFNDLDGVEWAVPYINRLFELGVVSGDGNGGFMPEKNVSREEFVKMIVEAAKLTEKSDISFEDVDKSEWYYNYIDIAYTNGIITGVSETEFGIGKYITRQEMAVIALRALSAMGKNIDTVENNEEFADNAAIADYARDAVYALRDMGIINGIGDNRFDPEGNTQRCAAAKVICMIIDREGK